MRSAVPTKDNPVEWDQDPFTSLLKDVNGVAGHCSQPAGRDLAGRPGSFPPVLRAGKQPSRQILEHRKRGIGQHGLEFPRPCRNCGDSSPFAEVLDEVDRRHPAAVGSAARPSLSSFNSNWESSGSDIANIHAGHVGSAFQVETCTWQRLARPGPRVTV